MADIPDDPGGTLPRRLQNNKSLRVPAQSDACLDSEKENSDEYPSGAKLAFIVTGIILSIFLASLDMTIVATAIPKITDEFGGLEEVSWYGSAFFLTNGGFQSSFGKSYKYFPLKTTFLVAIFIFEVGSLICALAPNSKALIVGRAICGVGAAGIGTGAYTIIGFVAPPAKRAAYTGSVGVSYGIASVVGPLVGGVFSDRVSWRWCFYINLPIGAISVLVIMLFFEAPKASQPVKAPWREKLLQMDPIGIFLIMGGLVAFILGLQYAGQKHAWSSGIVIGLLVASVLLYTVFSIWEYFQGERAMMVPRLLKQRPVGISCIYTFFFCGTYYLVLYYIPIYFQSVDNASPIMSGVYNLPLIVAVTVSMILSGLFISSTGLAFPVLIAGTLFAIMGGALLYTLQVNTSTGKWIGYQILAGVGWGVSFQIPMIIVQASAAPADLSSVSAMILFMMNVGGTSFLTAGQSAFVNTMINRLTVTAPNVDPRVVIQTGATEIRTKFRPDQILRVIEAYMAGIQVAFALVLGGACVALLVGLAIDRKRVNRKTATSAA